VTASGGTLNLTGTIGSSTHLAIATASASTLEISSASTIAPVSITSANQTLAINGNVTINAAQTVTNGTITIASGDTLTDTAGITLAGGTISGAGAPSNSTPISGYGTISSTLNGDVVTASGGTLTITGAVDTSSASTFNIASGATLALGGAVGTGSVTPTISFAAGSSGALDLTDLTGSNFHATISNFSTLNSIDVPNGTKITYSSTGSSTTITVDNGSTVLGTITLNGNYTSDSFSISGGVITEGPICYLRGTRVLTPTGERCIEDLKIGDLVVTRFGGTQPIKWIGRQSYSADDVRDDLETAPVHFRAGSLGEDVPSRDLFISPGHSMLIDGTLVLAKFLVNGITITQGRLPGMLDYFQLELDTHDCVLADGAWSETFADGPGLRDKFHNLAEFDAMFPDHRVPDALAPLCSPRPERGAALAVALKPIVERAGAGIAAGPLRGFIDRVDGLWKLDGWAQDSDHPQLPVLLEVLLADKVIGTVLACDFRQDLFDVFGHGNSSFVFESPVELRPELLHTLQVRRACDGAPVQINENIRTTVSMEVSAGMPAAAHDPDGHAPSEMPHVRAWGRRQVPHHIRMRFSGRDATRVRGSSASAA
jgi:hypothetical protein